MKDARGHGSSGSGGAKMFGGRQQPHIALRAQFSPGQRSPGFKQDDAAKQFASVRAGLAAHQSGIAGIARRFFSDVIHG